MLGLMQLFWLAIACLCLITILKGIGIGNDWDNISEAELKARQAEFAINLYTRGEVGLYKAYEISGLSPQEFTKLCECRRVSYRR